MAATTRRLFWVPFTVGLLYGFFYLYAIGDVSFYGPPAWGAHISEMSLDRMLSSRSLLMFEAVAVIEMGYVVWLFSPLNLMIAAMLAGLLAANIHGALYIHASPVCRPVRGGTIAGAIPALFAGGACCAPSLILLLGIPGLGATVAYFGWLVPISLIILGINRIWQHRRGVPPMYRLPLPLFR